MIRLFVMDVDGTMTDGAVFLDGEGREFKRFDVKDGLGVAMLAASGVRAAIISGRYSAVTDRRAKELGIDIVVQGVKDKLSELKRMASDMNLDPEEIAYIGDDVNDRECIAWAGRGFAPSDARHEAKEAADVVTEARGGSGAVRDAADDILNFNGTRETK
ncbi:MAG: HAD-IIIA family hydrolase [Thermovirgaceae bacterium]|jgi:3-deoxy-D-manno-octulosonate 8-phosphate phosphatase (KDO 8-P phosphatase)|nr:HAD-IIIA family hydrolase [Synergistales bacterium]MDI9392663.1 HAD-IIIA family hydrolase [Synergistota bacterium]NLV65478.1 HAD-IIIA family hydrolase [Synergistaceae bacterium]HRW88201.1 HAD-IIIA family hydrolase [Thermovirgaceae bacterium]MDD3134569.1 HAD-IIIA family hydrolase [Synergistales bacterium]